MTIKQYSDIQRLLGRLEGVGHALPDGFYQEFYDTLEELDSIFEEIYKTGVFLIQEGKPITTEEANKNGLF